MLYHQEQQQEQQQRQMANEDAHQDCSFRFEDDDEDAVTEASSSASYSTEEGDSNSSLQHYDDDEEDAHPDDSESSYDSLSSYDSHSPTASFQTWKQRAQQDGDADALYYLGVCYSYGERGAPQDSLKALECFRRAALQGHSNARYQWGWCYEQSIDGQIPQDRPRAVRIMTKGLDNPHAQCYIGWCYLNGEGGLDHDPRQGVQLLQRAVDQGLAEAQFHLANCYKEGQGVDDEPNLSMAIRLYKLAARQDHAGAQNNLGNRYYQGQGVHRNLKKALYWCKQAAQQGNEYSMVTVAECYRDGGDGIQQDLYQALHWFQKALDYGYEEAHEDIREVQDMIQRQVETLPKVILHKDAFQHDAQECSCCLESWNDDERPRILLPACGHSFCMECLVNVSKVTSGSHCQPGAADCPLCRKHFSLRNVKRVVPNH
mmetsp:Transcript_16495/g.45363  ORF Transcript_16495/g.45363 Transcript_16495/m.45363 type:complete len:430 (+) Transcript_16495:61-1350(+)